MDPRIARLQELLAEARRLKARGQWTKRAHRWLLAQAVRDAQPDSLECDPFVVELGEPT